MGALDRARTTDASHREGSTLGHSQNETHGMRSKLVVYLIDQPIERMRIRRSSAPLAESDFSAAL